mmetsp:Transcript_6203/g.10797  ORF Transcript_6203/g.10797 Transcript_6203/m.10797 type:complete len:621 (+) Transcript_6203:1-1863(+)
MVVVSVGLPAASRLGSTLSAPQVTGSCHLVSLLSFPHLCVVLDAAKTVEDIPDTQNAHGVSHDASRGVSNSDEDDNMNMAVEDITKDRAKLSASLPWAGSLQGVRLLAGPAGAGEPDAQAWAADASLFVVAYGQTLRVFAPPRSKLSHHNGGDTPVASKTTQNAQDFDAGKDDINVSQNVISVDSEKDFRNPAHTDPALGFEGLDKNWPTQTQTLVVRQRVRDLACSKCLSRDLNWIAVAGEHGVKVFDLEQQTPPIYLVRSFAVSLVTFHDNDLLVCTTDGHLGIWHLPSSLQEAKRESSRALDAAWRTVIDISGKFTSASFTPDGSYFSVASWRDGVYIYARTKTGQYVLDRHIEIHSELSRTMQHAMLVCFSLTQRPILAYTTHDNRHINFYDVISHQEVAPAWDDIGDVVTGMCCSMRGTLVMHTLHGHLSARKWPYQDVVTSPPPPRMPSLNGLPEIVANELKERHVLRHIVMDGIRVILTDGCAHICFMPKQKWRAVVTRSTAVGIVTGRIVIFAGPGASAKALHANIDTCTLEILSDVELVALDDSVSLNENSASEASFNEEGGSILAKAMRPTLKSREPKHILGGGKDKNGRILLATVYDVKHMPMLGIIRP